MSREYWEIWNDGEQARIDEDIERHRKAEGVLTLPDIAPGSEVLVEQISHDFVFGAHIFNFNQLGKKEYNDRYKSLFGTLFNSATIAFYWNEFEPLPGQKRFREEYRDTEEFWNNIAEPQKQAHWRRPATDPVVEFCESKGVRMHGHTLIWGSRRWHNPQWILQDMKTPDEKQKMDQLILTYADTENRQEADKYSEEYERLSATDLGEMFPELAREMKRLFEKRIIDIADHYGDRIHSWDVVNESATDYETGVLIPGSTITKSRYGIMPGDYTYEAFKVATGIFSDNVLLNINDYNLRQCYVEQTQQLLDRGCRVDVIGAQMHLFRPQQCLDIAAGKAIQTPTQIREWARRLGAVGLPIHLSEITITSPGNDEKGRNIQAVIAQNLYRLWFSLEPMMGITWWNTVDDCGAPGEPSVSGLFTRDMVGKPSFYALNNLINNEWTTTLTVRPDENGQVRFRGFKGNYRITWTDSLGNSQTQEYHL